MVTTCVFLGLGNIGAAYKHTRHNIGFDFIDWFLAAQGIQPNWVSKHQSFFYKHSYGDRQIVYVKPTTLMNLSGHSYVAWKKECRVAGLSMLVVTDDLDQTVGKFKYRLGGGHGGQNGLRHIKSLDAEDFWQLKIGIDRPATKDQVSQWVLGKPSPLHRTTILETTFPLIKERLCQEWCLP
jgi:peptidyl-tRNA hydrolase, PTH1 family